MHAVAFRLGARLKKRAFIQDRTKADEGPDAKLKMF
jgi:hypothetical protein